MGNFFRECVGGGWITRDHVELGRREGSVDSEVRRKCLMREAGGRWNLVKRAEIQWMPDSDDDA